MDPNLKLAKGLALDAGRAVMRIYESEDFSVTEKEDASPLTAADLASDNLIRAGLEATGHPVLSEESKDGPDRLSSDNLWVVDPLDGTKEFIKRNGEFTINIALIREGRPVLGVIYAPVLGELYYGSEEGAFMEKDGQTTRLRVSTVDDMGEMSLVMSRSHAGEMEKRLASLFSSSVSRGSSLKGCLVAAGEADAYLRTGPTSEWDVAAMDCIVHAAGGSMTLIDGEKRVYNQENVRVNGFLVSNGEAHDKILAEVNDG